MDSLRICLLAVAGVTVITVIRKWNSDFLPLVRLCLALLLAAVALALAAPVVDYLRELTALSGIPGYAEFLFKALGIAVNLGQASISLIQRKCSVGYNHAGKIIEWMEDMGYITPFDGKAKARGVLLSKEDFEAKYGDFN